MPMMRIEETEESISYIASIEEEMTPYHSSSSGIAKSSEHPPLRPLNFHPHLETSENKESQ